MVDGFQLQRFHAAQAGVYATALAELRTGRKRSHWVWFVFPQLRGLGRSANAHFYALAGLEEACAYLADPVLGHRLREATKAMLNHVDQPATTVLGEVDAMKFHSCLTLFARAAPDEPVFSQAIERFFDGEPDAATLALLNATPAS